MKNKLFSNILMIAAVLTFIGLTACQHENPVEPIERDFDYSMVLASPDLVVGSLSEASLTSDFTLVNVTDKMLYSPNDNGKGPGDKPFPPKPDPNRPPVKLGMLLRMLELDSAQRELVKGFFEEFEDCVKEYRIALREAQRAIIENANAQRRSIMEALKAGEITREQAMQALRQLREQTRQEMETNEVIVAARQGIKDCHDALLENIKSILTQKQLDIWNKFFGIKG